MGASDTKRVECLVGLTYMYFLVFYSLLLEVTAWRCQQARQSQGIGRRGNAHPPSYKLWDLPTTLFCSNHLGQDQPHAPKKLSSMRK